MKIIFYNTNSPNNKIQKELKDSLEKDVKLKMEGSILTPVLTIKSETFFNYNYCYIEKFKRCYFINDIEIYPNKIYILHLEVDVLMSFKNDILKSQCFISQQLKINPFYDDNSYKNEMKKEVNTYYSNTEILLENTQLLVTLGG